MKKTECVHTFTFLLTYDSINYLKAIRIEKNQTNQNILLQKKMHDRFSSLKRYLHRGAFNKSF